MAQCAQLRMRNIHLVKFTLAYKQKIQTDSLGKPYTSFQILQPSLFIVNVSNDTAFDSKMIGRQ